MKAPTDANTNDFPRDENGSIEDNDVYIDCQHGNQIYHYGHQTLVAYIPSIIRGHNIIKEIAGEIADKYKNDSGTYDYESLYKDEDLNKIIFNIVENDSEIEFRFNVKEIDLIAPLLKARTFGASIPPFSTKNLKRAEYHEITNAQMDEYESIKRLLPEGEFLLLGKLTNQFLTDFLPQNYKAKYGKIDIKADMKLKQLRGREYIHSIGEWDKYIEYLRKELS